MSDYKARVTGIGGIFFKAKDPAKMMEWYRKHLSFPENGSDPWQDDTCVAFRWREAGDVNKPGTTVWSVFKEDTKYFAPSDASLMVNYRVENLHEVLAALRAEGIWVDDKIEENDYGKFGWIMDPEGNKIELWEPPHGA